MVFDKLNMPLFPTMFELRGPIDYSYHVCKLERWTLGDEQPLSHYKIFHD